MIILKISIVLFNCKLFGLKVEMALSRQDVDTANANLVNVIRQQERNAIRQQVQTKFEAVVDYANNLQAEHQSDLRHFIGTAQQPLAQNQNVPVVSNAKNKLLKMKWLAFTRMVVH